MVLDRAYRGLVVAVRASFRASVRRLEGDSEGSPRLLLHAPQRHPEPVQASLLLTESSCSLSPIGNAFVEHAVSCALSFALHALDKERVSGILGGGLVVELEGDSEFYTGDCGKTGLGSSACVVSALVGALLHFFGLVDSNSEKDIETAYKVAQYAHCAAQGKVGSGFDVSCCFFGSHVYRRFSPSILSHVFDSACSEAAEGEGLGQLLSKISLDCEHSPFVLPPLMKLVLGDVRGGSETPGMVRQVLAWRKEHPKEIWEELSNLNEHVIYSLRTLVDLSTIDPISYSKSLEFALQVPGNRTCEEDCVLPALAVIRNIQSACLKIRNLFRAMGEQAGVDLEPIAQTELLDQTMSIPGVLFACVPGAGGSDAVATILLDIEQVESRVQDCWRELGVSVLTCADMFQKGVVFS